MSQLRTWVSREDWCQRIITFDASWFILTMGTGILVQNFHFFPWPAYWLKNLSYAFWVLDMVLFLLFIVMSVLRTIKYPKVALRVFDDFQQTSFLGAIPISLDAITAGLIIHYSDRQVAVYTAVAFYWIGVALTLAVGFGGIFAMYKHQGQHKLNEVTGVWLLTFIPLIVTAALGSTLAPYLLGNNASTVIVVSFLMWSVGVGICFMIIAIYLWRLMACSLPPRDAIVSCFVPVGPFGMGAFAILGLAIDLASFVSTISFDFHESSTPPVNTSSQAAVAQMIEWIGVMLCFALLGLASFFLVEAVASVIAKLPKTFNIGFWSFVFPCGVYSNAFCRLSTTLRNDALKGWAATCVVGTTLLWLMCVAMTLYKAIWCGKLFVAPGLQGFAEQELLDNMKSHLRADSSHNVSGGSNDQEAAPSHGGYMIASDGTFKRISDNMSKEQ